MTTEIQVFCPHCYNYVLISRVKCGIFRHGMYKDTLKQINPHLSKVKCDKLIMNDLIYGCGKPFKIEKINHTFIAVECDYI